MFKRWLRRFHAALGAYLAAKPEPARAEPDVLSHGWHRLDNSPAWLGDDGPGDDAPDFSGFRFGNSHGGRRRRLN
jgi:hypothetical protein